MEWPYLRPGVEPTTGTIIHWDISSPFLISSRYRSSLAKLPPVKIFELICFERLTSSGSSVDYHLHLLHVG